jgi:predicted TIM-barrel fold metal-dependent hydrolase
VEKAARDWPDLNFVIYHAAYRGSGLLGLDWMARGNQRRPPGEATAPIHDNPAEIPWITDLCRVLRRNPDIRNVYFELGGTFHLLSSMQPVTCMHALGQMLQAVGPERILWGTDSIWNGSPQSQIERFRRLKIRDDLVEQHGYPPLTDDIKRRILGLNAARLFGIDVDSARQAIAGDRLTCLRQEYLNLPAPSQTQFGWVWIDEGGGDPTLPVGESDA